MIVLKDNNDSIEISLASSVATNEADIMVSFDEILGSAKDEGRSLSRSNGTSAVTICDNNEPGYQIYIDYISIFNSDTANITITIKYKSGAQYYNLKTIELLPNEVLEFISGTGWIVK